MQPVTERLFNVYGAPQQGVPDAFLAEIDRIAKSYTVECQNLAGDMVISATKQNWWPSPGVIVEALSMAQDRLFAKNRDAGPKHPDWLPSRIAGANRLIRSPMGRQAAKEGWIGALWDFARVNERLPQGAELGNCKRISREADEKADEVYRGKGGICSDALLRLCKSREERHAQLAEIASGYEAKALSEQSQRMTGEA